MDKISFRLELLPNLLTVQIKKPQMLYSITFEALIRGVEGNRTPVQTPLP